MSRAANTALVSALLALGSGASAAADATAASATSAAAVSAGASAAADPGGLDQALQLAADDPALRALAQAWQGRAATLMAVLKDKDADRRRAAARLLGAGVGTGLTGADLLEALAACSDGEAQRLGVRGLRLDQVAPESLLGLGDPALVCRLLARHPRAEAIDQDEVAARLRAWLVVPATAGPAAALVAERGSAATWGPVLVRVIAGVPHRRHDQEGDDPVVVAAHHALAVLTRTQRDLAVYAGHYDLLAKDWRDQLAAETPATGPVDSGLAISIASLPDDPAAIDAVLAAGPSALPALDAAMAAADRTRRRVLAGIARLAARAVSPALYHELGPAGFDDMDAEDPADRRRALARAAGVVGRLHDSPGLRHLLSYVDDADPGVRAAALDLLVRLSDDHDKFAGGTWNYADGGLFPPACRAYLRRELRQGSRDEQVAAMQLLASMEAGELAEDVAAELVSPVPMVVDTAVETLGHLNDRSQLPQLVRLAGDSTQPAPRRVTALGVIARAAGNDNDGNPRQGARMLTELGKIEDGSDPTVQAAAAEARFAWSPAAQRRAQAATLLAAPATRMVALRLLAKKPLASEANGNSPPPVLDILSDLARPYLFADDPATATLAAKTLLAGIAAARDAQAGLFTADDRKNLAAWCHAHPGVFPEHLAIAAELAALPADELAALAAGMPPGPGTTRAWTSMISGAPDPSAALTAAARAQGDAPATVPHALVGPLLDRILHAAVRSPRLLAEIASSAAFRLFENTNDNTNQGADGTMVETKTVDLGGGVTLVFTGTQSPSASPPEGMASDSRFTWTLTSKPPPGAPADATISAWNDGLRSLRLEPDDARDRDLLICLLTPGALPAQTLAATVAKRTGWWQVVAARDPAARAVMIAGLSAQLPDIWELVNLIVNGNPDLVPAVLKALGGENQDWAIQSFMPYLVSLDRNALLPHLDELLAIPGLVADSHFPALLAHVGPVPLAVALTMLRTDHPPLVAIAPYAVSDLPVLQGALAALDAPTVFARLGYLRRLRDAAPTVFDRALPALIRSGDAKTAAWLRTGLPLAAGMRAPYLAAESSADPELWLVGAALALREQRMAPAAFLAHVVLLPPDRLPHAGLVASRYLGGRLTGQAPALAAILARCPRDGLAAWLSILPPDPGLAKPLADLAAVPANTEVLDQAFTRLADQDSAWQPLVQAVARAADHRLDDLLPEH